MKTPSTNVQRRRAVPPPSPPEVVAGIVNDGSAGRVAETAVRLARALGGRVRFVQVVPADFDDHERAEAEAITFSAALHALRGSPHVQATFESPSGDPRTLLVHRSRLALALVIGPDRPDADPAVAAYCQANSGCRVLEVAGDVAGDFEERPAAAINPDRLGSHPRP